MPLVEEAFVGVVTDNDGSAVTFGAGTPAAHLSASRPYYLEVVHGPLRGERFDVDVAATLAAGGPSVALVLGASSYSTIPVLTPAALVGARCVIRAHATLESLQAGFRPALVGRDLFLLADGVHVFENGGFTFYYLRADGRSWRKVGGNAEQRGKILPPDAGVLIDLKSGRKEWRHPGAVRVNPFRKNLAAGFQPFATGFPVDLSPAQIGAFTDPLAPEGTRWTGNVSPLLADQFALYGPTSPLAAYYLKADGRTWRSLTHPADVSAQPILPATGMLVLRRRKADPGFAVPLPAGL